MGRRELLHVVTIVSLIVGSFAFAPVPAAFAADNVYQVDNLGDADAGGNLSLYCTSAANDCSLRQAIKKANADSGTTEINFDNLSTGLQTVDNFWVIQPNSALPAIAGNGGTIIRGRSNVLAQPAIVIDGTNVPDTQANGLTITSGSNTIERLVIIKFIGADSTKGNGIVISGTNATGNTITGSYIGSKPFSSEIVPNSQAGIRIESSGNFIGGELDDKRNFISGNLGDGILLNTPNATKNILKNNYIGVVVGSGSSVVALGNGGYGIQLNNSPENTIGGTTVNSFNLIAASGRSGISLTGSQTISNTLSGNLIGVSELGRIKSGFGNTQDGIRFTDGASNNKVTSTAGLRTIIASNGNYGVYFSDPTTNNNTIESSYIGVDDTGAAAPNALGGVYFRNDVSGNIIGTPNAGNVISGNTGYAITITRLNSSFVSSVGNKIQANLIGLSPDGTATRPNSAGGIRVLDGAVETLIGGTAAGEGNTISGNGGPAITVSGSQAISTTIQGNLIGLKKVTGPVGTPYLGLYASAAGNTGDGILVNSGAIQTSIGGSSAAAGNTIVANGGHGISINDTGTLSTTIRYNTIGTVKPTTTYLSGFGNTGNGVFAGNGTTVVQIRNSTVFSNTLDGVRVAGNTQKVLILDTLISSNGGKGINLIGTTVGGNGISTNPNHDIDPPVNLRLNQAKQLTGNLIVDPKLTANNSKCITCTLQFFAANPTTLDSEGLKLLDASGLTISSNGYFTATLSEIPKQLVATATDINGNTSEFAVYTVTQSLDMGPNGQVKLAAPSSTITYTFKVTNTGTLDLTDLKTSATTTVPATGSNKQWPTTVEPPTLSLLAGQSKAVTATVTLPSGTDPRVIAGIHATTYVTTTSTSLPTVTASATAGTNVTQAFVLQVSPTSDTRTAMSDNPDALTTVTYRHTLTNSGNLTGTLQIGAATDLKWPTVLSFSSTTLNPGESKEVSIAVTIPASAAAGVKAKTSLVITQTSPLPTQTFRFTDTTTVGPGPKATIGFDQDTTADAGATVQFRHNVTNTGNLTSTFTLSITTKLGSSVQLVSNNGITINNQNEFTLGYYSNRILDFNAVVTVNPRALPGEIEQITIAVLDVDGHRLDSLQDTITVLKGKVVPRLYLPTAFRG